MRKALVLLLVTAGVLAQVAIEVRNEAARRAAFSLPPAPDYDGLLEVQGGAGEDLERFSVDGGPKFSTALVFQQGDYASLMTFTTDVLFDQRVVFCEGTRFDGPVVFGEGAPVVIAGAAWERPISDEEFVAHGMGWLGLE